MFCNSDIKQKGIDPVILTD